MTWTYSGTPAAGAHLLALGCATLLCSAAHAAELGVTLNCDRPTEHGFDEVFVVVAGKSATGHDVVLRAPATDRNFFRLSAGAAHNFSLADTVLKEGETMRLVVALFEDDDGPGTTWQSLATTMLRGMPPSLADLPGPLLQSFQALDEFRPRYDFLGAFTVTLTRVGGAVVATWAALDDAEAVPLADDKNAHLFRFAGDGANYSLSATVNPIDREEPLLSAR